MRITDDIFRVVSRQHSMPYCTSINTTYFNVHRELQILLYARTFQLANPKFERMKHGVSEPKAGKMDDTQSLSIFPPMQQDCSRSIESSSNDMDVGPSRKPGVPRRKPFVRCRSIDSGDIGLYKSVNNTPISKASSQSEEIHENYFDFSDCVDGMCNSSQIGKIDCGDVFNVERQEEQNTNDSTIINMIRNASGKGKGRKKKIPSLELSLINGPLTSFDHMETKRFLAPHEGSSNLQRSPKGAIAETTPSTSNTMYSSIFSNVGKCVMMPIDKDYETKYLLMNKMHGITGVNSFIPPGMKIKHEKTIKEHIYLFLEHPSGWFCFFYHMFV